MFCGRTIDIIPPMMTINKYINNSYVAHSREYLACIQQINCFVSE